MMNIRRVTMKRLFRSELIELNVQAESREDAITELTQFLGDENYLHSENKFLEDVFDREELGNTAVGFGVAIPHGKSTEVKESAIVFGRSDSGIDWDSFDGNLVHTIFLLAVPEEKASDEHLKILAMLSRSLMDEDFRAQLSTAKDKEEILSIFEKLVQENETQS